MEFRLELSTTNLLIGFNILMFIIASILAVLINPTFLPAFSRALVYMGADVYQEITVGEIFRLVTSSFLHANLFHLLLNMYALYYLGNFFERRFGGKSLFVLYIFAGLVGSLLSTLVHFVSIELGLTSANVYTIGVGASGALFGILGYILVNPYIYVDKRQLYMILFLNFLVGVAFAGLIDNWAHLGGLIGGMLLSKIDTSNMMRTMESKMTNLSYRIAVIIMILSYSALIVTLLA